MVNSILARVLISIIALSGVCFALYKAEQHIEGIGYNRAKTEVQLQVAKLQADAAQALATETARVRAAEQAASAAVATQNLKDTKNVKTITDLSNRLRADVAIGLRDPNATRCRSGISSPMPDPATPASSGASHAAQTDGLLSAELTGLLQQQTVEADTINNAYQSCRAWADAVTESTK